MNGTLTPANLKNWMIVATLMQNDIEKHLKAKEAERLLKEAIINFEAGNDSLAQEQILQAKLLASSVKINLQQEVQRILIETFEEADDINGNAWYPGYFDYEVFYAITRKIAKELDLVGYAERLINKSIAIQKIVEATRAFCDIEHKDSQIGHDLITEAKDFAEKAHFDLKNFCQIFLIPKILGFAVEEMEKRDYDTIDLWPDVARSIAKRVGLKDETEEKIQNLKDKHLGFGQGLGLKLTFAKQK